MATTSGAQAGQRRGAHQRYRNKGVQQNHGHETGAGGAGEFTPGQFQSESGCLLLQKQSPTEKCFAKIKDKLPCVKSDGKSYLPMTPLINTSVGMLGVVMTFCALSLIASVNTIPAILSN